MKQRKIALKISTACCLVLTSQAASLSASTVTVNTATRYQKIDGFGACVDENWNGNLENRPDFIKLLFSPDNGIGLSLMRVQTRCDDVEPDSTGPRSNQVACVRQHSKFRPT
jgi:O-glycosyl hydrolase